MYERELEFATRICKGAGELVMSQFPGMKYIPLDGNRDIIIQVERDVEDLVKAGISEEFPTHGILTEEGGAIGIDKEYVWVSDAIDGTINFVRQKEYFATCLALMENKKPVVGVIYLPYFEREFFAHKDGGAYCNNSRIVVSDTNLLFKSIVHIETNFHRNPENIQVRDALTKPTGRLHAVNSFAIESAYVAAGQSEAIASYSRLTDVAAGALLVQEAGGKVTDIDGNPFTLDSESIIASNGRIHEELVDALKK